MAMSYGKALKIIKSVEKVSMDKLNQELMKQGLTLDDFENAQNVLKKANAVMMNGDLFNQREVSLQDWKNLSFEDLAALEMSLSSKEEDNEQVLEEVRKTIAKKASYNNQHNIALSDNEIAAADYLVESGVISGEKSRKYMRSEILAYDFRYGLDDKETVEKWYESLFGDFNGKEAKSLIPDEAKKEISSYFANVKYYDCQHDEAGNEIPDENGKINYTEITDPKLIEKYNTAIIDSSILDVTSEIGRDAKNKTPEENKRDWLERLKDRIQYKIKFLTVDSKIEEKLKEIAKHAGTHQKKDAKDLAQVVETELEDKENLHRISVSAIAMDSAQSVVRSRNIAKRAYVKVKNSKYVAFFGKLINKIDATAKSLWNNRYEIAKNVANNFKDGKYTKLARLLVGTATAGVVAHCALPVAITACVAYGGYSIADNFLSPIFDEQMKIKRLAKEKGEKVPSFRERWKMAKEAKKNDKKYLEKRKHGVIWGVIGAGAAGVLGAVGGPLAGPLMARAAVRLGIAGSTVTTQAVNYAHAEKEEKTKAGFELGVAVALSTVAAFANIGNLTAGVSPDASNIKEVVSGSDLTDVDASETVQNSEDAYYTDAERTAVTDSVAEGEAPADVEADAAVEENAAEAQAAEEVAPAYQNPYEEKLLMKRIEKWIPNKEQREQFLNDLRNANLREANPELAGLTDAQLAYLMIRHMHNTPDKMVEKIANSLSDCGDMTKEDIAAYVLKAKETYNLEQGMGKLGENMKYVESDCVTAVMHNANTDDCGAIDHKIVTKGNCYDDAQPETTKAEVPAEDIKVDEPVEKLETPRRIIPTEDPKTPEIEQKETPQTEEVEVVEDKGRRARRLTIGNGKGKNSYGSSASVIGDSKGGSWGNFKNGRFTKTH